MPENSPATPQANPSSPAAAAEAVPQKLDLPPGVRLYECMWVVDANVGREDYNKLIAGLKEIVEKGGGTWVNADKWEERRLAYPIKKKKRVLYVINHFTAPSEAITEIDRNARLSELVLRHMITVDEDGLATTPPARSPDDDDFVGGPGGGMGGGGERRFFGGGGGRRGPAPDGEGGPRKAD
jgi:small subunit ribosomal protein S6